MTERKIFITPAYLRELAGAMEAVDIGCLSSTFEENLNLIKDILAAHDRGRLDKLVNMEIAMMRGSDEIR